MSGLRIENALMQKLFECRKLEILGMFDGMRNPVQNLKKKIPVHDIIMRGGNLNSVVRDKTMLAGKIAGRDRIDDNMNRIFEQHMSNSSRHLLGQRANRSIAYLCGN